MESKNVPYLSNDNESASATWNIPTLPYMQANAVRAEVFTPDFCFAQRNSPFTAVEIFNLSEYSLMKGLTSTLVGIDDACTPEKLHFSLPPSKKQKTYNGSDHHDDVDDADIWIKFHNQMRIQFPMHTYTENQWEKNETLVCLTMLYPRVVTKLFLSRQSACQYAIDTLLEIIPWLKPEHSLFEIHKALQAFEAKQMEKLLGVGYDENGEHLAWSSRRAMPFMLGGLLDLCDDVIFGGSHLYLNPPDVPLGMTVYFEDAARSSYYNKLPLGFGPHENPIATDRITTRFATEFPNWRAQASALFLKIDQKLDVIEAKINGATQEDRNEYYKYGGAYLGEFFRLFEENYFQAIERW